MFVAKRHESWSAFAVHPVMYCIIPRSKNKGAAAFRHNHKQKKNEWDLASRSFLHIGETRLLASLLGMLYFIRQSLFIIVLLHVLSRGREHQLNAVQLVDLAGTGIIIHCRDIGLRVQLFQLLDHALSDYVIWQAGKGLNADDVGNALGDQLDHLTG